MAGPDPSCWLRYVHQRWLFVVFAVFSLSSFSSSVAHVAQEAVFQTSSSSMKVSRNSSTYNIVQTIKSSFDQIGPLQCETVCEVKGDPRVDSCINRPLPACAAQCENKCMSEKQYSRDGFRFKVCVEGCTQFCAFHDCCGARQAAVDSVDGAPLL
eukprot:INCI17464.1.p2 GENE.INCI17464.1~~INCI17464.1.p2  ORF type:complete len:155 (+),score=22.44 INCI17464.1:167-631(+)